MPNRNDGTNPNYLPLPSVEIAALRARVAELEAWQLAIAEGTGFVNYAEGQSGYEVADPQTILNHFKC